MVSFGDGAFDALQTITGSLDLSGNTSMTTIDAGAFEALETVGDATNGGNLYISGNTSLATATITGCFPALKDVYGGLLLTGNTAPGFTTIAATEFPLLETVGGNSTSGGSLDLGNNDNLTTIADAFPLLKTVEIDLHHH